VAVDIINFGEEIENSKLLENFINAVDKNNSHLVHVPPGEILSDVLISSPIICEEGSAPGISSDPFGGVDPNLDPELAHVLQVSLEEERVRRAEADAKKEREKNQDKEKGVETVSEKTTESTPNESVSHPTTDVEMADIDDDVELVRAIELSLAGKSSSEAEKTQSQEEKPKEDLKDVSQHPPTQPTNVNEKEQKSHQDTSMDVEDDEMQLALSLSMQLNSLPTNTQPSINTTQTSNTPSQTETQPEPFSDMMNDPDFVHSILTGLPGVNPEDERIKDVLQSFKSSSQAEKDKKDEDKK